ncbi:MAG: endolytic transglycosylase MltG [Candidatus Kaiserbacteria bacterium]|nr:endolytic transglycosylase MltG [Candidatus Kaiserbacteria bacterium]MCB9815997.1 endolytic transglycosylase MltG [Candidatus Nomurabacteria bacterium]
MSEERVNFHPNTMEPSSAKIRRVHWIFKLLAMIVILGACTLGVLYWYLNRLNQPPVLFPIDQAVTIEQGMNVNAITEMLAEKHIVQSKALLYYIILLFHDPTDIKASTYVFEHPLTTGEIALQLTQGDFDTDLVRFTHIEGERATMIAARAADVLPNFNPSNFIAEAEPLEGRLYPDTYFIPADYTDKQLLTLLLETFDEKTAPLEAQVASSSLSFDEILVLASIIEREANTPESMRLVSSVLQNRLEIDMALQTDASIEYILDKPLSELTPEDLEINSLYNTYLYPGLPPTPIGNPGLDAIMAVLEPAESEYFYYITDNEGVFHFSETYNQHLRNIDLYLK